PPSFQQRSLDPETLILPVSLNLSFSRSIAFSSKAEASVIILNVDPGSNVLHIGKFLSKISAAADSQEAGSKLGREDIAIIPPVLILLPMNQQQLRFSIEI